MPVETPASNILPLKFEWLGLQNLRLLKGRVQAVAELRSPELSPREMHLARLVWENRARSEYVGVLHLQNFHAQLVDLNVPMDLQELILQFMLEEQRHVGLCMQAARALGSRSTIPTDPREFDSWTDHLIARSPSEKVLAFIVQAFCIGEVIALDLLRATLAHVPESPYRELLVAIQKDEVVHSRVGPLLLEEIRTRGASWCPWPGDAWIESVAQQALEGLARRPVIEPEEQHTSALLAAVPSGEFTYQVYVQSVDRLRKEYRHAPTSLAHPSHRSHQSHGSPSAHCRT